MIQFIIELCMLCTPGIITEQYYSYLVQKEGRYPHTVFRTITFSMVVLMLRCMFSVAGGHGDFEVSAVFHGTGNFVHYCVLSIFVITFVPPCLLIVQKLLTNMRLR